MHNYTIPQSVKDRVVSRMGRLYAHETIDASRTALVVVDMQNYFVAEGHPAEVPAARQIVPAINRMAAAMRKAGGNVVWIQTTAVGAIEKWRNFQTRMLTPERQEKRLAGLAEESEGYKLYPKLDVQPGDMRVKKIRYSAFIEGSSDIDAQLRRRGIDTVLITGTLTNVCCESTARDAMLLDYKAIMLSDGNATLSDEEHAGTMNTFMLFFGDVMSTDDAVGRLVAADKRKSA